MSHWIPLRQRKFPQPAPPVGLTGTAAALALALLAAGCMDIIGHSADFDRHRYSQLVESQSRPGLIYFDVSFPAAYPAGDPAADRTRAAWLEGWLDQRRLCPAGHEVTTRRPFDYLEDNPARFQERWEVRCLEPGAG